MHGEVKYLLIILIAGCLLFALLVNMERLYNSVLKVFQRIKYHYYSQLFYSADIQAKIPDFQNKLDQRVQIVKGMLAKTYNIPMNIVSIPYFGLNIPVLYIDRSEVSFMKSENKEMWDFLIKGSAGTSIFLDYDLKRYKQEWTADQLNSLFEKIQVIIISNNPQKMASIKYELFTLCPHLIKNRLAGYEHAYKLITGKYEYFTDKTMPNEIKFDLIGYCFLDNEISYIDVFVNMKEIAPK